MSLNKTQADICDRRRQVLARLMVRRPRVTQRQLREALTSKGHVNPETQEAWSLGTINNDVEAIREAARKRMGEDADTWRARELDMLRQLQADAWNEGEFRTVVSISKRRAKLLGLDEPEQVEQAVSVLESGEYQRLRSTIMEALSEHPEARAAIAASLSTDE